MNIEQYTFFKAQISSISETGNASRVYYADMKIRQYGNATLYSHLAFLAIDSQPKCSIP